MTAKPLLGVVISTHDRVDDARINLEIVNALWSKRFDLRIVHAYNGAPERWTTNGAEDNYKTIRRRNLGHFAGAVDLMEVGMLALAGEHHDCLCRDCVRRDREGIEGIAPPSYAVHMSADTWLTNPDYLAGVIGEMGHGEKRLASCAWGNELDDNPWTLGLALDFCVVDLAWAFRYGMLPLHYEDFREKYEELVHYLGSNVYPERVLALRFLQALRNETPSISDNTMREAGNAALLRMSEREPVHRTVPLEYKLCPSPRLFKPAGRDTRNEEIGLYSGHDAKGKQDVIRKLGLAKIGPHATRLAEARDLSYYNSGTV